MFYVEFVKRSRLNAFALLLSLGTESHDDNFTAEMNFQLFEEAPLGFSHSVRMALHFNEEKGPSIRCVHEKIRRLAGETSRAEKRQTLTSQYSLGDTECHGVGTKRIFLDKYSIALLPIVLGDEPFSKMIAVLSLVPDDFVIPKAEQRRAFPHPLRRKVSFFPLGEQIRRICEIFRFHRFPLD